MKIEDILDICLEEIKKSKNIKELLSQYPQISSELEPLLIFAGKIKNLPEPEIRRESGCRFFNFQP